MSLPDVVLVEVLADLAALTFVFCALCADFAALAAAGLALLGAAEPLAFFAAGLAALAFFAGAAFLAAGLAAFLAGAALAAGLTSLANALAICFTAPFLAGAAALAVDLLALAALVLLALAVLVALVVVAGFLATVFFGAVLVFAATFGSLSLIVEAKRPRVIAYRRIGGNRCRPNRRARTLTSPLLFILRFYKRFISPMLGPRCRFHPSCSEYAAEAISKHGHFHGSWLAAKRLARCHPMSEGGFDPVPERKPR